LNNPGTEAREAKRRNEQQEAELNALNELSNFKAVLKDPSGRQVLKWLHKYCQGDGELTDKTSSKVYENLGQDRVWKELAKKLKKASKGDYYSFLQEFEI